MQRLFLPDHLTRRDIVKAWATSTLLRRARTDVDGVEVRNKRM